ncbi:MAG: type II toxin-antitoxin system HicA family toxin [Acidimicrobiia bacterium]|nr:type II toxin-antitoxin system HicA family toxin [Acidimicrobiia bacterium]MDQ3499527.1 type II toxin-antitoxin system HicA family toxin [Actinomycetota bacterium]
MRPERLLRRIRAGDVSNLRFEDVLNLSMKLGFELTRRSGSHHILRHPDLSEALNLQDAAGQAKPYQVRQFRDLVLRYNLQIGNKT